MHELGANAYRGGTGPLRVIRGKVRCVASGCGRRGRMALVELGVLGGMPLRTRLRATQNVCGVCGWVVARVRAGGGEAGVLYMSVGSPTHTHAHHHPRPLAALSVLTPPAVIACIALTVHRTRVRSSMHGSKQASRCTSEWLRPRAATGVCPERAPSALTRSPVALPFIHPCCGGASAKSASRDERHTSAGAGHSAGSATLPQCAVPCAHSAERCSERRRPGRRAVLQRPLMQAGYSFTDDMNGFQQVAPAMPPGPPRAAAFRPLCRVATGRTVRCTHARIACGALCAVNAAGTAGSLPPAIAGGDGLHGHDDRRR